MNINKLHIAGRLTADPKPKTISSGVCVVNSTIALNNRVKKNGEWTDEVAFVPITFWDKKAEYVANYFSKGDYIYVEGRLKLDTWIVKETGKPASRLSVVADNVVSFSWKLKEGDYAYAHQRDEDDDDAMDYPEFSEEDIEL